MRILKSLVILRLAFLPSISSCGNYLMNVVGSYMFGEGNSSQILLQNLTRLNAKTSQFTPEYIQHVSRLTRQYLGTYCATESYTQSDCLLRPEMPPIVAKARYAMFLVMVNNYSLGCSFCEQDQQICDTIYLTQPYRAIDLLYELGSDFVEENFNRMVYVVIYMAGLMVILLAILALQIYSICCLKRMRKYDSDSTLTAPL